MSLNKYIHLSIQQGLNLETESIATFQTQPVAAIVEQPLPLITDNVTVDEKVVEDCQSWLSFHPVWGQLPAEALQAIARLVDSEQPDYLTVIYAYLPLTLAANLTHYIPAAMTEAGQILPVFARTLGYSGADLPTLTWSLDVAQFLQGVTLLSVMVFSPYPLLRITKRSLFKNIPHLLLMLGFTVFFFNFSADF